MRAGVLVSFATVAPTGDDSTGADGDGAYGHVTADGAGSRFGPKRGA